MPSAEMRQRPHITGEVDFTTQSVGKFQMLVYRQQILISDLCTALFVLCVYIVEEDTGELVPFIAALILCMRAPFS